MLPKQLSDRQDLVETVDSEIIDYLSKHGVIDDSLIGQLQKLQSCTERNVALLSAIESKGDTAVALFVNALRQSGQLHLASSLDKAPRIKPTVQGGYLDKPRHKGEVTVSIEVEALLINVPEGDTEGDFPETAFQDDSKIENGQKFQQTLSKSTCNSKLSQRSIENVCYSRKDSKKHRSKLPIFFCFCFPQRKGNAPNKPLCNTERNHADNSWDTILGNDTMNVERRNAQQRKYQKFPLLHSFLVTNVNENSKYLNNIHSDEMKITSRFSKRSASKVCQHKGEKVYEKSNNNLKRFLFRLGKQNNNGAICSRMSPKWKYAGFHFMENMASIRELFKSPDMQVKIIKYFEQERGTLVLSTWTKERCFYVCNICMRKVHVKQLQRAQNDGSLCERLYRIIISNLEELNILDMRLCLNLNAIYVHEALQELE